MAWGNWGVTKSTRRMMYSSRDGMGQRAREGGLHSTCFGAHIISTCGEEKRVDSKKRDNCPRTIEWARNAGNREEKSPSNRKITLRPMGP